MPKLSLIFALLIATPLLLAEQAEAAAPAAAAKPAAAPAAIVANVASGASIFKEVCSHCHRTDYDASAVGAPGLKDVRERHTPAWLDHWLKAPGDFAKTDETAKALIKSNPYGLVMPSLPEMQDNQKRADIIAYLQTL